MGRWGDGEMGRWGDKGKLFFWAALNIIPWSKTLVKKLRGVVLHPSENCYK
ncbi:MAG: hypothetical protein F6K36_08480 [Symploca sp. SIO3C6]|nr:hypothetical protein [Symploca sp. SIO3C6]